MSQLRKFVNSVPEYRRTGKGNFKHRLSDLLMLVIMARLSKCVTRQEILSFGRHNLRRLQAMGLLKRGLPSEPTLCRVFKSIDDEEMAHCLSAFSESFRKEIRKSEMEIICVDGKAMKGTVYDNGRNPDIVSAYSAEAGITLATDVCEEKSNEIRSVPKLLDKLDISGSIITADAMSCQKAIIDKIREKGADFVIELKANQRSLRYSLEDSLQMAIPADIHVEDPCLDHGRIETRTCRVYRGEELITDKEKWNGHLTVIQVDTVTERKANSQTSSEKRLYLSSLDCNAKLLSRITRRHWLIESMHWDLDRNFLQDKIKRKTARAARNLDTIQRMVHAILSIWKHKRRKYSDKRKGTAELIRELAHSFTKVIRMLLQK